nr:hypothetical protein [uncultured Methanolobus sp.]
MIVKVSLEIEVDEDNRNLAIEKAHVLLEAVLLLCRWNVQDVTFFNGIPVDHDCSDSSDYPGNSKGGIWGDD